MTHPVYALLGASAAVTAIVGAPPNMRVYAAGAIPDGAALPVLTYQIISGQPESYIDAGATIERQRVQVDAWALTHAAAEQLQLVAMRAIENGGRNVCINNNGPDYEPETKRFRSSRDFEVWVDL